MNPDFFFSNSLSKHEVLLFDHVVDCLRITLNNSGLPFSFVDDLEGLQPRALAARAESHKHFTKRHTSAIICQLTVVLEVLIKLPNVLSLRLFISQIPPLNLGSNASKS